MSSYPLFYCGGDTGFDFLVSVFFLPKFYVKHFLYFLSLGHLKHVQKLFYFSCCRLFLDLDRARLNCCFVFLIF